MKIEKINFDNLNMLYNACQLNDPAHKINFGNNFHKLLEHINIYMIISDINIFEAMMLKQFVSEYTEFNTYTEIKSAKDANEFKVFSGMESLLKEMNNDSDIKVNPGFMLMPIDYINKKVNVKLTGPSIINVLNGTPESFFTKLKFIQDYKNSKNKYPDRLWLDDSTINEISNQLISGFYVSFYQYVIDTLKLSDIKSDSAIMTDSYSYVSPTKQIALTNVSTPFGGINFTDNGDNINHDVIKIKNGFKEYEYMNKLSNTSLYFTVYSSLYSFFELYLALPNTVFVDNMDLKIPLSMQTDLITFHETEKYSYRLDKKVKDIINNLNEFIANEKKELNDESNKSIGTKIPNLMHRLSKLPLNVSISYSIKIKLSDCNDLILPFRDDISNGMYGDNTYLSKEMDSILETINNLAINIYKLIM